MPGFSLSNFCQFFKNNLKNLFNDLPSYTPTRQHFFALMAVCVLAQIGIYYFGKLPPNTHTSSYHIAVNDEMVHPLLEQLNATHPNQTGVYLLNDGKDAFASRLMLAKNAKKTLDIQYYIWKKDLTGVLLFQAIQQSAERGVRVRLLLDDNNTKGLDTILLALDKHPNIDVRLYNPNKYRQIRSLGFLANFSRLNRRMHNKSMTADNQISITGGRNIGDEYFHVAGNPVFADLDTLLIGHIVPEISQDFDRYWNSASAYPLGQIIDKSLLGEYTENKASQNDILQQLLQTQQRQNPKFQQIEQQYLTSLQQLDFTKQVRNNRLTFNWTTAKLVSDNPRKTLNHLNKQALISQLIFENMSNPQRHLTIVSPYFIPTKTGANQLIQLAKQGIDIQILTNAMSATDVKIVHSGYAKYRKLLLENGIKINELKPDISIGNIKDTYLTGHTGTSLHAKTFEIDRERLFIGSYNLDPRSANLNTEMGIIIENPQITEQLAQRLQQALGENSYHVSLDSHGNLQWQTLENGQLVQYQNEPHTTAFERGMVWLMAKLPIEWLL